MTFKAKDLRERTPEDLRELEKTLAKDVFQNRFKNFTNRLDDTSAIKKTRRDLARVKTLLAAAAAVALKNAPEASVAKVAKSAPAKKAAPVKAKAAPKAETKAAAVEAAPVKAKKTAKKTAAKDEAK
jgi:large subunit ribosomal protein L29